MCNDKPVKLWQRENDVYRFEDPVLKIEEDKGLFIKIGENKMGRNSSTKMR